MYTRWLLMFAMLTAATTDAAQRTFVASNGIDNASCSINAPCRGFAAAVVATSPNGEVIVLDSAGYGSVTITKAVSIIAPSGVYAGISVFPGSDGVTVAAGAADKVVLRGLTINGQGGNNGIHVMSALETHIEDCTIANMIHAGIFIEGGERVHIMRAVVRDNLDKGVFVTPGPSIMSRITTTLSDSTLTNNGVTGVFGLTQGPAADVNIMLTRVTAIGQSNVAFLASSLDGTLSMAIADSFAADNFNGAVAIGSNATMIVSGSSLVKNVSFDVRQEDSAVLRTAGNNAVTGRGASDVNGSLTPNPLK